ncbi:hypothetical protein AMS59_05285 [Lysinibacillus sp. FJAT-14745]|nr:hypothetical protein AMS59_05285 [Lysinibacillus sp. FJAT-14745]
MDKVRNFIGTKVFYLFLCFAKLLPATNPVDLLLITITLYIIIIPTFLLLYNKTKENKTEVSGNNLIKKMHNSSYKNRRVVHELKLFHTR